METTEPIACTLTAAELEDRQAAWLKVGAFATKAVEITGGLAFEFRAAPGVHRALEALVALEAECCPWMRFGLEDAGTIVLTITATGDGGEEAVRLDFAPLRRHAEPESSHAGA